MFESLDFVYLPAPDIESSVDYYKNTLGGKLSWKIHAYGVWVACIVLSEEEPYILLANHLEKNDIVLIYNVSNLEKTVFQLRSKGWEEEKRLDIPPGPCCTFRDPANNHIAIYEKLRLNIMKEFEGRIDVKENE